jgi:hypothetical protein
VWKITQFDDILGLLQKSIAGNIISGFGGWFKYKLEISPIFRVGSRNSLLGKEGHPALHIKIHGQFQIYVIQIPKFHGQFQNFFTNKRGLDPGHPLYTSIKEVQLVMK